MDEPLITGHAAPAAQPEPEPAPRPDELAGEQAARERRSRWKTPLTLAALAAVAGLLGLLGWATLTAGRGSNLVAKVARGEKPMAPRFELEVIWRRSETWPQSVLPALADGNVNLPELRGRPVVINFWASWCIPCREEAPILHAGAARHRGRVAFLGVDVKDLTADALDFLREFDVNYVSVRDGGGDETWDAYGLTGVPETYFVDSPGRIVAHVPGAVSARTLEEGAAAITAAGGGGALQGGAHVTP